MWRQQESGYSHMVMNLMLQILMKVAQEVKVHQHRPLGMEMEVSILKNMRMYLKYVHKC